ncbi:hypothetical protein ACTMTF_07420 [Nonomuraea sp. ZG12]|uniref:hypothetical protein n=1 Tax=Nonomuraea sp. ZG12 TaxID=3452207 RepID=UPI003F8885D9
MPGRSIKQVTLIGAVAFTGFITGCDSPVTGDTTPEGQERHKAPGLPGCAL